MEKEELLVRWQCVKYSVSHFVEFLNHQADSKCMHMQTKTITKQVYHYQCQSSGEH